MDLYMLILFFAYLSSVSILVKQNAFIANQDDLSSHTDIAKIPRLPGDGAQSSDATIETTITNEIKTTTTKFTAPGSNGEQESKIKDGVKGQGGWYFF